MMKKVLAGICWYIFLCAPLFAQTHHSVSLENKVYYILEQSEIRGLCRPLSGVRPYTHSVVSAAINEILSTDKAEKLKKTEREILEQYLNKWAKPKNGLDWQRGAWYGESAIGKSGVPVSANFGIGADMQGSAGLYSSFQDRYFGTEIWVQAYANGDLGNNVSYNIIFEGGLVQVPRNPLPGKYNTYYEGFPKEGEPETADSEYANKKIDIFSEPLTHFPYAYKKRWDGSVFFFNKLDGFDTWPNSIAGAYGLPAELTASFFDNKLIARMGRISHDWGSTSSGSSLAFNQMARPFLAVEAELNPVSWFGISSLTGVLEYYNLDGIKASSRVFQNAFSITMMQFRYKEYLFFDVVDAVVWPKRFELGYMLPVVNSFMYQNNIGDFDNMAMTFNLKAQYPGLGNIWGSIFIDEMNLTSDLLTLDRQMVAMQGGANVPLPLLSFSSLKLSYTRVNPYCYTHNRNYNPWYGDLRMETAYLNNGVNLGYYLPPNSDEILARLKTMPVKNLTTSLQYQLIRHGADFGPSAVDGSNILSELDPDDRDGNSVLKRYFLRDGAYQWSHIIKIGAEWNLPGTPVSLCGEAGVNYSYFTNIEAEANVTGKAHSYARINTTDYPESTGFIVKIGLKVFPR
jgi:hypothetical protein